jgi:hypothetical protein
MVNSFDRKQFNVKLTRQIKEFTDKGGQITKLPVSPEASKIRKEIKGKYFKRF